MYRLIRRLLFRMNPERVHDLTIQAIRMAGSNPVTRALVRGLYDYEDPAQRVQAFGLDFPNPVGLAAGYDKDALGWRGLTCLGFGHLELGTVTPRPQPGNPCPRLFRSIPHEAIVNRYGFPNRGADFVARRLRLRRPDDTIVGMNLGKNKDTPLEAAAADYLSLVQTFAPLADYLVINVSSPNTEGLRRLQARDALEGILRELHRERERQQERLGRRVPILVKLAPDLDDAELNDSLGAILDSDMDGIVATNTTISREGFDSPIAGEKGGLSGAPLRALATAKVRTIHERTGGKLPIVGVGGVAGPDDAREKMDAGATLVQVYTGMIYQGPGLVKQILRAL